MSIVKLNNQGVKNATAFGSAVTSLGSMTFIKKLTASSSATLSFVDGSDGVVLDDTYKEYVFTFNNIHPSADGVDLNFQASTNGGSSYGVTATDSYFRAIHNESDTTTQLAYDTGEDVAQSTSFFPLTMPIGSDNDKNGCAILHLFNPSSTTFVKHFTSTSQILNQSNFSGNVFVGGYFNTTSSINAVRFQLDSGNIDAGDICLYGIA